jgi:hypothetical protein
MCTLELMVPSEQLFNTNEWLINRFVTIQHPGNSKMCTLELMVPSEPLNNTFESLMSRFVTETTPRPQQEVDTGVGGAI